MVSAPLSILSNSSSPFDTISPTQYISPFFACLPRTMPEPQQAAASSLAAHASSSEHDDTDMRAPAEDTAYEVDGDEFGGDEFDDPLMAKVLEIAEAEVEKNERLKQLKRALAEWKKAVDQATKLRKPAMKPIANTAFITAVTQLKSSRPDTIAQQLDRMILRYAEPPTGDQQVQEAEQTAETAKQTAKQALVSFEEARATIATAEVELAKMQQSLTGDGSVANDEAVSESDGEDWRTRANGMASMLDRTFLSTGGFSKERNDKLKEMGAWFCEGVKLWYIPTHRQEEERVACLAIWSERALSFEQLRTLLGKRFGWSDK